MDSPQDLLQQALTLPNGSRLKNRLAKSAMSEALGTTDNHATEALVRLYGRWAAGGPRMARQSAGSSTRA